MNTISISPKHLITEALKNSFPYAEYTKKISRFTAQKKTSGPEQSEARIAFTALNYQRMKRLDKTVKIDSATMEKLHKIPEKIIWLVITETWCGDAAQVNPVLNKMEEVSPNLKLRFVFRDENPELMDAFLTNGARSIPKLIAFNENKEVLYTWGSRPSQATKMVTDYKEKHGVLTPEFKQELQLWYNKNKGQNIIDDQLELLDQLRS